MIEAMKQALENLDEYYITTPEGQKLVTALRTAIEQVEKQEPTGKQSLQVEQEPVAEVKLKTTGGNVGIATVIHEIYSHYREPLRPGDKLYTTPPAAQRQPLTDEEIKSVIRAGEYDSMEDFARAIEAAHGIGEKK